MSTLLVVTVTLPRRSIISMTQAQAAAILMVTTAERLNTTSSIHLKRYGGGWHLSSAQLRLHIPSEDLIEELTRLQDCVVFIPRKDLKKAKVALDKTPHKIAYYRSDGTIVNKDRS